jgi:hypothetical protein
MNQDKMKLKSMITTLLIIFVIGSFAALMFKETKRHSVTNQEPENLKKQESKPSTTVGNEANNQANGRKVIAYYFYGNIRCPTCLTIEKYSRVAIREAFSQELDSGLLEWRPTNVELKENEHFNDDYKLVTRSLVFVEYRDRKQVKWKNLDKIWDLVENQPKFFEYVQSEMRTFLNGS